MFSVKRAVDFDFGANWKSFSERALTAKAIAQAKEDFVDLTAEVDLRGNSFLDIGFGQGLSLLIATLMGANTIGCDINPLCAEVLQMNQRRHFPELADRRIPVVVGSILDERIVDLLRKAPDQTTRAYNVVHSWGVLHHTGDMKRAIQIAASLVAPGGYLIIAIYARHWSSGGWRMIKRFYNRSSQIVQRMLVGILYPTIYLAKWLVMRRSPLQQTRGMDFYYDVVDWVGGYPYEYATVEEIQSLVEPLGFRLERIIPATVPTGCNQFVFRSQRS
ncbi:MAG: class I SAM-dependent methyltransferase [Verrucomicrobiota bacterium]